MHSHSLVEIQIFEKWAAGSGVFGNALAAAYHAGVNWPRGHHFRYAAKATLAENLKVTSIQSLFSSGIMLTHVAG